MSLYTLQTTDVLPSVESPVGLRMEVSTNLDLLACMGNITANDVASRMANDHVGFVAYLNDVPAAFGWMASGKARIGELAHELVLPVGNRYLWNFRTMEGFRGKGIYPALLQYILFQERKKANRFWIIHAPENQSSLNGIKKAGFQYVGKLYTKSGIATIEKTHLSKATQNLLAEMDITISDEVPSSCWNCSSPYLKTRKSECCCATSGSECVGNKLISLDS